MSNFYDRSKIVAAMVPVLVHKINPTKTQVKKGTGAQISERRNGSVMYVIPELGLSRTQRPLGASILENCAANVGKQAHALPLEGPTSQTYSLLVFNDRSDSFEEGLSSGYSSSLFE